ncbi:Mitotic control protein dis3 [Giardia muris]|uniref:Mitotic control protein dis3 n=1 Tax=Giardia muris TaxID=5742 RepID=A0A4Z1SP00_GIAMU|nr:Mitotic control protein dis3 [Giardia muris]|eukprot:TNJ26585.1 Mitotic control protein dis3 [Giardia muris]
MPIPKVTTPKKTRYVKAGPTSRALVVRTDIPCGLEGCTACGGPGLKAGGRVIILPDSRFCLEYPAAFDALLKADVILILCDSVLDVLSSLSATRAKYVRSTITSAAKSILFRDKSCSETTGGYAVCSTSEQLADALRASALFYAKHASTIHEYDVLILAADEAIQRTISDALEHHIFSYRPEQLFTVDQYRKHGLESIGMKAEDWEALALTCSTFGESADPFSYPPHFAQQRIEELLKEGKICRGRLVSLGRGRGGEVRQGNIIIKLSSPFYMNRGLSKDIVAVAILKEQWWSEAQRGLPIPYTDPCLILEKDELDAFLLRPVEREEGRKVAYGIVVGIVSRATLEFCGTLKVPFPLVSIGETEEEGVTPMIGNTSLLRPYDRLLPDFFITSPSTLQYAVGKRLVVVLASWESDERSPRAFVKTVLGDVGNRDVEASVLMKEYGIRHNDVYLEDDVLKELAAVGFSNGEYSIPPNIYLNSVGPSTPLPDTEYKDLLSRNLRLAKKYSGLRLDLTEEYVVSVDPYTCKDIDDALHLKRLANNIFEVGVHIADVAHYVHPDAQIDLEARQRGTTVYFPDRRIDMLPHVLTEEVCSLRCWTDRLAMSVIYELEVYESDEGQEVDGVDFGLLAGLTGVEASLRVRVIDSHFTKTIIRSRGSLAYAEAQWLCEMDVPSVDVMYEGGAYMEMSAAIRPHLNEGFAANQIKVTRIQQSLKALLFLSRLLKAERLRKGALILESPGVDFQLDPETKMPIRLQEHKHLSTMSMVEEFMLLANHSAATRILEAYPSFAILRRHPKPTDAMFSTLRVQVRKMFGFELNTESNLSLSCSVHKAYAEGVLTDSQLSTVRQLLIRCMALAKYFSASEFTQDEYAHYGLALDVYTHFTSPIRRYSDILVHRLLAAAEHFDVLPPSHAVTDIMERVCQALNERKEAADRASTEASRIFSTLYVLGRWKALHGDMRPLTTHANVLRLCSECITVVLHELGTEGLVRCKDQTVQIDDLGLWIDLREPDGSVRRVSVFDEVLVEVSFDFSRIYAFELRVTLLRP